MLSHGQTFPIYLHNNTVVRLQVESMQPAGFACLRLGHGSEIAVAPKPRASSASRPAPDAQQFVSDSERPSSITLRLLPPWAADVALEPAAQRRYDELAALFVSSAVLDQLRWSDGELVMLYPLLPSSADAHALHSVARVFALPSWNPRRTADDGAVAITSPLLLLSASLPLFSRVQYVRCPPSFPPSRSVLSGLLAPRCQRLSSTADERAITIPYSIATSHVGAVRTRRSVAASAEQCLPTTGARRCARYVY